MVDPENYPAKTKWFSYPLIIRDPAFSAGGLRLGGEGFC